MLLLQKKDEWIYPVYFKDAITFTKFFKPSIELIHVCTRNVKVTQVLFACKQPFDCIFFKYLPNQMLCSSVALSLEGGLWIAKKGSNSGKYPLLL